MKLNGKIIVIILEVALIPLLLMGFISDFVFQKEHTEQMLNSLDAIAQTQKNRLQESLQDKQDLLGLLVSKQSLKTYVHEFNISPTSDAQKKIQDSLLETKGGVVGFQKVFVANPDGVIIASTDASLLGVNVVAEEFFKRGIKQNDVSFFQKDAVTNIPSQYLAGRLIQEGRVEGVIVVVIEANDIISLVEDYTGLGKTGETLLVTRDAQGNVLFVSPVRFDPNAAFNRVVSKEKTNVPSVHAISGQEAVFTDVVDYRNVPVFAATRYLKDVNWGIVVKIDKAEVLEPMHRVRGLFIFILMMAGLLIALIGVSISRSITNPLRQLTTMAKKIAAGNLSQSVLVTSKDEVGELGSVFNDMAKKLEEYQSGLEEKIRERTAELQSSEEKFRDFFELSADPACIADIEGYFRQVNSSFVRVLGYSEKEILGRPYMDFIYPDDKKKTQKIIDEKLKQGATVLSFENRYVRKDGGIVWFEWMSRPIPDKKITFAVARNITERKLVEQKLIVSAKELEVAKSQDEAMLASIGDGMIAVDVDERIIAMSGATEKMIGWHFDEIKGKNLHDVLPIVDEQGKNLEREKRPMYIALTTGKSIVTSIGTTYFYARKDGTHFPVAIAASPVILKGKIIGAIDNFRDIAKEREIDRAKTEFVSLASHQLRSPLTVVKWYIEMLLSRGGVKSKKKEKEYLGEVYRGNQNAIELVNILLDISRLELGTYVVELEPTDFVELAKGALDEQKIKIKEKKLSCAVTFAKNLPMVRTDKKLFRMVFQNLLSNAVKYTPAKGKIDLSLSLKGRKNILLKVSDTGYGIPKIQQDKIFTKFFRADNVRSKDTEGTGLGLYIAKSIVEKHEGKIWFESEESKGTTFYVSIPIT